MERLVEPELLDQLPSSDPRAIHSRRDLRRINSWMGNFRLIERELVSLSTPPKTILEVGAGDGSLMAKLAGRFGPVWGKDVAIYLLDMHPSISEGTRDFIQSYGWRMEVLQVDLRDWLKAPGPKEADVLLANLFLHHFSFEELRLFFGAFSKITRMFLASDPRRWKLSLLAVRLLWLIGCNSVTRYDARVSIRGGFKGKELSALWPTESGFRLEESDPGWASHLFMAHKGSSSGGF